MRILEFERETPVPEWIARPRDPRVVVSWVNDVKVLKNGPICTVFVENEERAPANDVFEILDLRPKWRRWIGRLLRLESAIDFSVKIRLVSRPFDSRTDLGQKVGV